MEKIMTKRLELVSSIWILRTHSNYGKSPKLLLLSIFLVSIATERTHLPMAKTTDSSISETTNASNSVTNNSSTSETTVSILEIPNSSKLPKAPLCIASVDKEGIVIDCRNKGLTKLPMNEIPSSAVKLYLDNNNLSDLPDNVFKKCKQLKFMSLSVNRLEYVSPLAFRGLDHLEHLNLEQNKLNLSGSMWDQKPFKYLHKLKTLKLSSNDNKFIDGKYNNNLLGGLQNLYELTIDTFYGDLYFGDIFSELRSLKSLVLNGFVTGLQNTTFESLNQLGLVDLSFEDLDYLNVIELDSFSPLTKLESLSITSVEIGIESSLRSLYAFRNRTMKNLHFHDISKSQFTPGDVLSTDGILDHYKTEFLSQICVKSFILSLSNVYVLKGNVLTGKVWRDCVQSVDMSYNNLIGDRMAILQVHRLKKLRVLNLSYRKLPCHKPTNFQTIVRNMIEDYDMYSYTEGGSTSNIQEIPSLISTEQDLKDSNGSHHNESNVNIIQDDTFSNQLLNNTVYFYFPKNLEVFIGDSISTNIGKVSDTFIIRRGERLREMYVSDNGLNNFTGTIKGLSSLKVLDLSYNDCSTIKILFFQFMTTIEFLNMRGTDLNGEFMSQHSERLFRPLRNLTYVDLSGNNLRLLSPDIFVKNALVRKLILARNRFRNIPVDISYFLRLSHLDMSFNSITQLSQSEMQSLDKHSKKVSSFSLTLGGNVMSCGCSSIRYLMWLENTKVDLDKHLNFTCINEDGIQTTISEIGDVKSLWRRCHGRVFFLLSLIIFCLIIIGFVLTISCIKFKTRLKSFIYRIVLQNFEMKSPADFRFGVFIDYADADTRFACFTLRDFIQSELRYSTYVRDINMVPASDFAETVVDAVNSSWRVVFIITADFLDREWSYFTMKTAAYVVGPSNPHQVIILVEDRVRHKLPACLLHAVEEDNIVSISSTQILTYELQQRLYHLIQPHYSHD